MDGVFCFHHILTAGAIHFALYGYRSMVTSPRKKKPKYGNKLQGQAIANNLVAHSIYFLFVALTSCLNGYEILCPLNVNEASSK
jgi:hypothetical protein